MHAPVVFSQEARGVKKVFQVLRVMLEYFVCAKDYKLRHVVKGLRKLCMMINDLGAKTKRDLSYNKVYIYMRVELPHLPSFIALALLLYLFVKHCRRNTFQSYNTRRHQKYLLCSETLAQRDPAHISHIVCLAASSTPFENNPIFLDGAINKNTRASRDRFNF
jgi:hypothetical protein